MSSQAYETPVPPHGLGSYDQAAPRPGGRDTGLSIEIIDNGIVVARSQQTAHEYNVPERLAFVDQASALEFLSGWLVEVFPPEIG
jgi:hypothetical protein